MKFGDPEPRLRRRKRVTVLGELCWMVGHGGCKERSVSKAYIWVSKGRSRKHDFERETIKLDHYARLRLSDACPGLSNTFLCP